LFISGKKITESKLPAHGIENVSAARQRPAANPKFGKGYNLTFRISFALQ
jgi:hypothetical protein